MQKIIRTRWTNHFEDDFIDLDKSIPGILNMIKYTGYVYILINIHELSRSLTLIPLPLSFDPPTKFSFAPIGRPAPALQSLLSIIRAAVAVASAVPEPSLMAGDLEFSLPVGYG